MIEHGKIISVKKDLAVVRIMRTSACGNCNMCNISQKDKFVDLTVPNTLNATVDQTVELDITGVSATATSLIVYVIPLVFAFLVMLLASIFPLPDWALVLIFVFGLAIGFIFVRCIDKRYASKLKLIPRMLKIEENDNERINNQS
ncbi:MAG: SoxR reducing system RseC family protein [Clostridia bacterium]